MSSHETMHWLVLSLLLTTALACDCREKWRALSATEATNLQAAAIFRMTVSAWDAATGFQGLKETCYNYWNSSSARPQSVIHHNLWSCDGFAVGSDNYAYLFYAIKDGSPVGDTGWKTGRTVYLLDRYEHVKCYNRSFDALYYYFNSGFRDQIDHFDCAFPTGNSLTGCCFFNIDDNVKYPAQPGLVKNCDLQHTFVDPEHPENWAPYGSTPAIMDYAFQSWGSARLVDVTTRFFRAYGHRYGYGLNPECRADQITLYEPDTQCATVRQGCVVAPCNSTAALQTTPPCGGNGYCVRQTNPGAGFPPYGCECKRFGDIPAWYAEGANDFNIGGTPKHEGLYKFGGYACQMPDPYIQCTDAGEGGGYICGKQSGGAAYCSKENYYADCRNSLPPYPEFTADFYDWRLHCVCPEETALEGTYCTQSRCKTYNGTADQTKCHSSATPTGGSCVYNAYDAVYECSCPADWTGKNCELTTRPSGDFPGVWYNGLVCAGHGEVVYDRHVSNQSSVHCDCSISGGLATGQFCEIVSCDPQQIWPGRGHCEGSFSWTSDLNCFKGPEGCGPGQSFLCHQVFMSSAASVPPLHCDVDVCALYGGAGYVLPGKNVALCNCSSVWSVGDYNAPANYLLGSDPLSASHNPLCFPRCLDDCKGGSGHCVITIVNSSVPFYPPVHYSNCACPSFIPGVGTGCVTVAHPQLAAPYNPPPGQLVLGTEPWCFNGGTWHGAGQPCSCLPCWSGTRCDVTRCEHGGSCTLDGNGCQCTGPWNGTLCTRSKCCSTGDCANPPFGVFVEGSFQSGQCACNAPFHPSSGDSQDCDVHDCGHGALIDKTLLAYVPLEQRCTCDSGWYTVCDSYTCSYCAKDPCSPNPCEHNSSCAATSPNGACSCSRGYTGPRCEVNIDDCVPGACQNGGTCRDGIESYLCACPDGFEGLHCEININECLWSPCQNNGVCIDGANSYQCVCPQGFSGINCEIAVPACASSPCRNGGLCKELAGSSAYVCMCRDGWSGDLCEVPVNECASGPCRNGATCQDLVAAFQCVCAKGWQGVLCDSELKPNATIPTDPTTREGSLPTSAAATVITVISISAVSGVAYTIASLLRHLRVLSSTL